MRHDHPQKFGETFSHPLSNGVIYSIVATFDSHFDPLTEESVAKALKRYQKLFTLTV